ncbi:protein LURP-one-related 15-like [Musa acuminata AAA Group]|uniref:protein LURP-one-related 15-like n=1 Tax=Musa acuminata AAA Group TaxID=214697 RepID=UPI0031CF25B2
MMQSSSRISRPDAIVDPRFCASYPIDLTFFIDAAWLNCDHLAVTDINGNVVFKVEAHKWSLRNRQVVVDASGKPVISMQQKLRSVHDRWQVFKGDSSDPKDLLFSVRRSSALQFKTELDVFLAANTEEEVCDFKMKGSYGERSCTVYKGDSSTVVAQMSKEYKFVNSSVSKNAFGVAISPNTDHSFIVALLIIQHELQLHNEHSEASGAVVGGISDGIFQGLAAALGGS